MSLSLERRLRLQAVENERAKSDPSVAEGRRDEQPQARGFGGLLGHLFRQARMVVIVFVVGIGSVVLAFAYILFAPEERSTALRWDGTYVDTSDAAALRASDEYGARAGQGWFERRFCDGSESGVCSE